MFFREVLKRVKPGAEEAYHNAAILYLIDDQIPAYFLSICMHHISTIKSNSDPRYIRRYWPDIVRTFRTYNRLKK